MSAEPKKKAPFVKANRREPLEDKWQKGSQHQDITRKLENALFTKYYSEVNKLCDADRWAKEMELFRTPLPTTVWINDTDSYAQEVRRVLSSETNSMVEPIHWYPIEGMAWRIHASRTVFRKDPSSQTLRRFLIQQTAMGTISRQEEVSMIPPFLLDIQPTDVCLDMCASPGSKTAQMLVALGRYKAIPADSDASPFPFDYASDGLVIANELDTKRANMLVYQVKRLRLLFPFALFTNHDARYFPDVPLSEDSAGVPQPLFDKILCDVVCSGDGTLRKAPHMLRTWSPKEGMGLQKLQIQIAFRGCHLLKIGGRLVYSTCTMNPIENEAVVAQLLRRTQGAVRLVDVRGMLPLLDADEGMTTWQVMDGKGNIVPSPTYPFHAALFPPTDNLGETEPGYDLRRCLRLLPTRSKGGAFFIAVFEKVAEFRITKRIQEEGEAEDGASATATEKVEDAVVPPAVEPAQDSDAKDEDAGEKKGKKHGKKRGRGGAADRFNKKPKEPVIPPQYVPVSKEMADSLKTFYGMEKFPTEYLVVRTAPGMMESTYSTCTKGSLVSKTAREVLQKRPENMVVVSAGLRVMAYDSLDNGWRVTNESAPLFAKLMRGSPRLLKISSALLEQMMTQGGKLKAVRFEEVEDDAARAQLEAIPLGSILVEAPCPTEPSGLGYCVGMRAHKQVQLLVNHEDLIATHVRFGIPIPEDASPEETSDASNNDQVNSDAAADVENGDEDDNNDDNSDKV